MKLDNIQAKIRSRNQWEAIDLGFVFARQWFFQLWLAWVILALPVFIVFHFIFSDKIWLASLCLWWFKPLFEQPLLYIISRQLFAERVDFKYLLTHLFSIIKPQLLANLSWRRFSVQRSFNNPVSMLERLRGKQRTERLLLLHRQQKVSSWLTLIGVHIEAVFNLSIIALISQLIPSGTDWLEFTDFFDQASEHYQLASWIGNVAYFLSLSIFAPFYVAAGFSLYLYSRIKLEGWEIEITFKQLNNRLDKLKTMTPMLLFCLVMAGSLLPSQPLYAETADSNVATQRSSLDAEQAKKEIDAVLQQADFGVQRMVTKWRIKSDETEQEKSEFPDWLTRFFNWLFKGTEEASVDNFLNIASIIEILFWLVAAAVIVFLWKKLGPTFRGYTWTRRGNVKSKKQPAEVTLLAQQLELDKLPEDIILQVQQYCKNKEFRAAVGLLYRAALNSLIEKAGMEIPYSATETDCSRIVDAMRPEQESSYFKQLTQSWLVVAYGHDTPLAEDVLALSRQWQRYYGTVE